MLRERQLKGLIIKTGAITKNRYNDYEIGFDFTAKEMRDMANLMETLGNGIMTFNIAIPKETWKDQIGKMMVFVVLTKEPENAP